MTTIKSIISGKCPNCKVENIFQTKGNLLLFKMPRMKNKCEKCKFKLNRETGFFTGAMYVCYGLVVIELIILYIVSSIMFNLSLLHQYLGLVFSVVIISTFNFRFSRIIWIYMFYKRKN